MGKLEKYSSYKDSGVEWLGEIPENWEIKKLKFIVKEHGGNGFPISEQGNMDGFIPFYKVSDMNGNDTFIEQSNNYVSELTIKKMKWNLIPVNSIITAKIGEALRKNHRKITKIPSIIDNNCIALEPIRIDIKFNFYLHKVIDFDWFSNVGAVPSISVPQYKNFKITLPPKQEQIKIASFLDEKTSQIDEVISQKEKLIELLKERKQIVINDAVTKGLDKEVEFVDSGVEWINKIPKHWKIKKLKFVFKEINERSETGEEELLSLSKYQGVIPKSSLEERAGMAKTLVGYKKVYKNDLVINKMQAVNGLLAVSKIEGITSPDYAVYRTISDKYNIDYYGNLLSQSVYLSEFKKVVTGVMEGFIRLYTDDLYNIIVQVPPEDEQLQIVEYIENQIIKIDKAIELQQNYISKLKEYKASLIDSVVTGKVRVA